MKLIFNSRIPKLLKVEAIVLWPFVFFASDKQTSWVNRTYHHEMIHVGQIKRVGVLRFYLSYAMFYCAHRLFGLNKETAYRNIPWEIEAFHWQNKGEE